MHPETPTAHELDLMRWLDGQMTAEERSSFEAALAATPSLLAEAISLQSLSLGLRESFPRAELKNEDFFNHQIQQAIAAEQPKPQPAKQSAVWNWLRSPWALGAAAAALALCFTLWPEAQVSQVVGSYAPTTGVEVRSYYDEGARATVLSLEGLAELPAERQLVGYSISHSSTDTAVAQTTLYDAAGSIVAVVAQNSESQPVIIAR